LPTSFMLWQDKSVQCEKEYKPCQNFDLQFLTRHNLAHALGVVARAKGMAQIAGQTGLSREQLYRSFSENGNPTLKTTLAVMRALGLDLTAKVHA